MRIPRIYQDGMYNSGDILHLSTGASHHIINVLHMKPEQSIILFNGNGGFFDCTIQSVDKKHKVLVKIGRHHDDDNISTLNLTLVQGISRAQRMDYTLQKAVELGVTRLVPVFCEYGNVMLTGERQGRRLEHWRKLVINACEQCGLNRIPSLQSPVNLSDWLEEENEGLKIILHPVSDCNLSHLRRPAHNIIILAGPEGGFSENEIRLAVANGYQPARLGPRILRTETAALVAITVCQVLWGDI